MDWITPEIAIGNYLDARDDGLLKESGIASVLNLDGNLQGISRSTLAVLESHPLIDGPGNDPRYFLRAVEVLERLAGRFPPVLIQCHAGRSRSPLVVAGYLIKTRKINPAEAVAIIAAKRNIAITPGLERMLDFVEDTV